MQFRLILAVLALGAVAACGGSSTRTVELDPEGVNRPVADRNTDAPNWFERMMGADNRPNVGPCPLMGVLYDNARLVEFAQPGLERYSNIAWTGEMQGVRGLCRYVDADPIRMAIEIDMAFGRGPAAGGAESRTYRYWVAVTRRGVAPIEKQYFDVEARFRDGNVATARERIESIVIPRANETVSGENFEILVGFDLTPEQVEFNRDGKRFRVDSVTTAPPTQ